MFQSLKGLQPKWNVKGQGISTTCKRIVSIPKRVTAKVERGWFPTVHSQERRFQSLKGLQPKWNNMDRLYLTANDWVSIPKRVTAKVELSEFALATQTDYVSIPKRVTAKVEPRSNQHPHPQKPLFQSLKGLQPKWNLRGKWSAAHTFRFNP